MSTVIPDWARAAATEIVRVYGIEPIDASPTGPRQEYAERATADIAAIIMRCGTEVKAADQSGDVAAQGTKP